jgi:hypothetical protein
MRTLNKIFLLWIAYALLMGFALGGSFVFAYLTSPAIEQGCAEGQTTDLKCQTPDERQRTAEAALSYYTKWLMIFTAVLAAATWEWASLLSASIFPVKIKSGSLETNFFHRIAQGCA